MLFSGKENIFMCLVTFQKIFWKIFFGVWRRRRKRQTQKKDCAIAPRLTSSAITPSIDDHAIDRDLSQRAATIDDRDRRARSLDDRTTRRSRRWSIDERARRTIAPLVSLSLRSGLSLLSLSLRSGLSLLSLSLRSGLSLLSLSLSFSENELKWKWGCKFISGSKA